MAENLNSTDFDLEKEDIEEISGLDRRFRFGDPKAFDPKLSIFAWSATGRRGRDGDRMLAKTAKLVAYDFKGRTHICIRAYMRE
jgi:hypothetical protein